MVQALDASLWKAAFGFLDSTGSCPAILSDDVSGLRTAEGYVVVIFGRVKWKDGDITYMMVYSPIASLYLRPYALGRCLNGDTQIVDHACTR